MHRDALHFYDKRPRRILGDREVGLAALQPHAPLRRGEQNGDRRAAVEVHLRTIGESLLLTQGQRRHGDGGSGGGRAVKKTDRRNHGQACGDERHHESPACGRSPVRGRQQRRVGPGMHRGLQPVEPVEFLPTPPLFGKRRAVPRMRREPRRKRVLLGRGEPALVPHHPRGGLGLGPGRGARFWIGWIHARRPRP